MKTILGLMLSVVMVLTIPVIAFGQTKNQNVDLLITNTTIVDVIRDTVLPRKTIAILNGHIIAISDSPNGYTAAKIIDGSHFVAMPGFVDTHTHLWQHLCKSCSPKESLQVWIKVYNDVHYLTADQLYKVVSAASAEALLSGITTVSDYASLSFNDYAFDANARAMHDAGLGGVIVYNNPSVFLPDSIKLKEIPAFQKTYKDRFNIWMGYGPLSFYTIPQVYSGIVIGNKLGMNYSEHTMENNQEQRDFYDSTTSYYDSYKNSLSGSDADFLNGLLAAKRPSNVDAFQQLVSLKTQILRTDSILQAEKDPKYSPLSEDEKRILSGVVYQRLISPLNLLEYLNGLNGFLSIHSVWPQQEDIAIMKRNNITISHNPESNLYLSSGMAPIDDYLRNNITVSLGTDGAASNDGINMFDAMREMWNVYKIKLLNVEMSKKIRDWDILNAATINGAKALKIDDRTGSISVGKDADISLLSTDELGMSPLRPQTLPSILIYSANSRNVKYVIADGKIVVENGNLKTLNEAELAVDLTKIANDADKMFSTGKTWAENINLTDVTLREYVYRYRSVRKLDSLNVVLVNHLNHPIKVTIASSGAVFGGGTPAVIDETAGSRFPMSQSAMAFKDMFVLKPNERITLRKVRDHVTKERIFSYEIISGNSDLKRTVANGQLLVLAENKYKIFN